MSKSRLFTSLDKLTFEIEPAAGDKFSTFSVKIKPLAYHFEVMEYLAKFDKKSIHGVSIKADTSTGQREVHLAFIPSPSIELDKGDQTFRQTVAKLNKADLTLHDCERIITAYESYLKRNNISSALTPTVSKSPSFDFSGSAY